MSKPVISAQKAQGELIEAAKSYARIEDRIYELAQDLVWEIIQRIEKENDVVDADGTLVTSDTTESELWYDEAREDAMQYMYEKMEDFFKQ